MCPDVSATPADGVSPAVNEPHFHFLSRRPLCSATLPARLKLGESGYLDPLKSAVTKGGLIWKSGCGIKTATPEHFNAFCLIWWQQPLTFIRLL